MLGYADLKVPESAPGLLAGFPAEVRRRFLGTEWCIRHDTVSAVPAQSELTV
ncbi:hypothetical protein [Streptomyces capitiformicae]|uniref:Uncharacterized protein n=1 Tax=Streptomyces capitiformicae TaxID=2014920 RepID=A0A918ZFI6_9ACTN|nr:hypothetical protein [Streptomyces capitiformicae]GHE49865.1 hypothetical protein GCM10017771_71400 [Streptomyces capitiformicae]